MGTGQLTIDLDAIAANWRALDAATDGTVRTAAVVKANGYGLGAAPAARTLAAAGARDFFVATAEEGAELRRILGPGPEISVFSGHMAGDTPLLAEAGLVPMLNSAEQFARHRGALPGHAFGVQLDSGMNRLGMEPGEWAGLRVEALAAGPRLLMSHLACADDPVHPANAAQLRSFRDMTDGAGVPRSLAATGGILLGRDYHFDLCRPGIGLYGGRPFTAAQPVVTLDLPVIQVRELEPGETVGYGCTWCAEARSVIATVSGGYADGITRHISNRASLYAGDEACPIRGRVSMDLIGVDITHLPEPPEALMLLGPRQGVDDIADCAGTIGYEILTSFGGRYRRNYRGAAAGARG